MLSDFTELWQLYFGLLFMATVVHAPGGLAGIVMMHRPLWRAGTIWRLAPAYALLLVPVGLISAGGLMMIEMAAHLRMKAAEGSAMSAAGIAYDAASWRPWALSLVAIAVGLVLVRRAWRHVEAVWDDARTAAKEKGVAA
jgi:branched-chain amino acid transport system permease protein